VIGVEEAVSMLCDAATPPDLKQDRA
jgi:hypothetical protein